MEPQQGGNCRTEAAQLFLFPAVGELAGNQLCDQSFLLTRSCWFAGKTCAFITRLQRHKAGKLSLSRPWKSRLWTALIQESRPALGPCYYHGRGTEAELGVPVPETGKLNRKLKELPCWTPPLGPKLRG